MMTTESTPPTLSQLTEAAAIFFPEGLVGCPSWQRFVHVVDSEEELPVSILQSLDDPDVRLLVTDPALIDPHYSASASAADREFLHCTDDCDPAVLCTLSVTAEGTISANLLGPILVDPRTRRGRQVVLAESHYSTNHPVAQLTKDGA